MLSFSSLSWQEVGSYLCTLYLFLSHTHSLTRAPCRHHHHHHRSLSLSLVDQLLFQGEELGEERRKEKKEANDDEDDNSSCFLAYSQRNHENDEGEIWYKVAVPTNERNQI